MEKSSKCPWFNESSSCPFVLDSNNCPWPDIKCDNRKEKPKKGGEK